jgi:tryptophanyl-tRNA synthetase
MTSAESDTVDHLLFPERMVALLRPARALELGTYTGALSVCLRFQELCPGECFVEIADRPDFTFAIDRPRAASAFGAVRGLLALGLDPDKSSIYLQSEVPQTCELMWTLACFLRGRAPSRWSATERARDGHSLGAHLYPLLQAAGVLCQRATRVAAGIGQPKLVELARSCAKLLNSNSELAVVPEPALVAPSTAGGFRGDASWFGLSEAPPLSILQDDSVLKEEIDRLFASPRSHGAPGVSAAAPLVAALTLLAPEVAHDTRRALATGQITLESVKQLLVTQLCERFREPRLRYRELEARVPLIRELLGDAAARARREACGDTILRVKEALGD